MFQLNRAPQGSAIYRTARSAEGHERCLHGSVSNLPAGHFKPERDLFQLIGLYRVPRRKMHLPQSPTPSASGNWKATTASRRRLNALSIAFLKISRNDDDAVISFKALQQIVGFLIGIAVVSGFNVRAAAHQRIALVEQQNHVQIFRAAQHPAQIFFRLTYVLIDNRREIDPVQIEAHLAGRDPALREFCLRR